MKSVMLKVTLKEDTSKEQLMVVLWEYMRYMVNDDHEMKTVERYDIEVETSYE